MSRHTFGSVGPDADGRRGAGHATAPGEATAPGDGTAAAAPAAPAGPGEGETAQVGPLRAELAASIYAGLALVVRRFRVQASQLHPGLSLTAYTLLLHLDETGGARATELVESYQLNKSTVSRQLAELAAAGLVERELDASDSRAQIIRISPPGRELLTKISDSLQAGLLSRTETWPDQDLKTFVQLLRRYNESDTLLPGWPVPDPAPASDPAPDTEPEAPPVRAGPYS